MALSLALIGTFYFWDLISFPVCFSFLFYFHAIKWRFTLVWSEFQLKKIKFIHHIDRLGIKSNTIQITFAAFLGSHFPDLIFFSLLENSEKLKNEERS